MLPPTNVSPLILLRRFHVRKIQWCQLHNLNLGLLWTSNGGCLAFLLEAGQFGEPSLDVRFRLENAYDAFKLWLQQSRFTCSQRRFTQKMLFKAEHGPYLSAKGWNSRVICAWLADVMGSSWQPLLAAGIHDPAEIILITNAVTCGCNSATDRFVAGFCICGFAWLVCPFAEARHRSQGLLFQSTSGSRKGLLCF